MSAALSIARGALIASPRSHDLHWKLKMRSKLVPSSPRIKNKNSLVVSAASNFLETYKSAPPTAKVAFKTGIYITTFGLALLAFPQAVIQFFSTPNSIPAVGWVRVGGTLASLFGFYYFGAALDDLEGRFPLRFYQSTILGRLFLAVVFIGLVLTEQSNGSLLLLGLANILSAFAMKRQIDTAVATGRMVPPP